MSSKRAATFKMTGDSGPAGERPNSPSPSTQRSQQTSRSQTPHRPASSSRPSHHHRQPSGAIDSIPPERRPLLQRAVFTHDGTAEPWYSCVANPHGHLPVYTNIHRIRRDIISIVEDYLSLEQLRDVRINLSVVRPLVDKLYELDDISVVYCLLVNRAQFLYEQSHLHNRQNVNATRAMLCELVAIRILRRFNEDNDGPEGLLVLAQILVAGFEPFQNAPPEVREEAEMSTEWSLKRTLPALEVAIVSESKMFLSSTSCQKVVDAIYEGRVIYTPSSFLNIIPDRYKQKPISLYNPREAPLLNQYRLIVPRTRKYLELFQFVVLLVLYLSFMAERDASHLTGVELCFAIYALGWCLDQFATILEHGWHVYTQNLWSFLDVAFTFVYWAYFFLRLYGLQVDDPNGDVKDGYGQQALDVLAMGAPFLVPRIAFNLLSDNLVFVCLRSMLADFALLTALAAWCFCGFLLSLLWLGNGEHHVLTILRWMIYIWFGLDGSGIARSTEFHWLLGPGLMVTFACLGNTLFLTILVSMLSHTFSTIVQNATAEVQYRHAVQTLEGVKSDILTMYNPPFNILALLILVPLKFLVSPRWFHKIHVTCVRLINAPLLLVIALAERHLLQPLGTPARPHSTSTGFIKPFPNSAPTEGGWLLRRGWFWEKWRITSHGDIQAVFEIPPPDSVLEDIAADDDLTHHLIRRQFMPRQKSMADNIPLASSSKRDAGGVGGGDGVADTTSKQAAMLRGESSLGGGTATTTAGGSSDGTRTPKPLKPVTRRDSIAPYAGLASQLRAALSEDEDIAALSDRLASLEETTERIERLLSRLVEGGIGAGEGEGESVGELEEEDQSAIEIED